MTTATTLPTVSLPTDNPDAYQVVTVLPPPHFRSTAQIGINLKSRTDWNRFNRQSFGVKLRIDTGKIAEVIVYSGSPERMSGYLDDAGGAVLEKVIRRDSFATKCLADIEVKL